jgi:GNAT superfamily N-acetyltransferase
MWQMPETVEFTPTTASRDEWIRYHRFRRLQHAEWHTDEPFVPDEMEEMRAKRRDPNQWVRECHVLDGDEVVAELETEGTSPESPEYATNKHLMWASGYVLRSHRRRGLALSWVPRVLDQMAEHGATVLSSPAEDETGHALNRRLGGEPRMVERASRLDLQQLDWDMVTRWVREGEASGGGYTLQLHRDWVPEDAVAEYSEALNELLNTMPFEGLDHGDIVTTPETLREDRARTVHLGSVNPTCLVRDAGGAIVGITDMIRRPYEVGVVRQEFTGVHPRARGHGIGKWLKAAMLLHIREAYPDTHWISTENAGSNEPMLAINHALGFRLHRTVTYYQVGRDIVRGAII